MEYVKKVVKARLGANANGFFAKTDIKSVPKIDARIIEVNAAFGSIPASTIIFGIKKKR